MEYKESKISVKWLEDKIQNEIATYGSISSKMISILAEQAIAIHKKESIDLLNHHNDVFDSSEEHYDKWFGGNK
jgi:hypothetical protein